MYRKHFLIYFHIGDWMQTQPRIWAREHQQCIIGCGFTNAQDDHPTTEQIEGYLLHELHFKMLENEEIVLLYNLNQNL